MQQYENFLEQVHRLLSLPGTGVHQIVRAIDGLLDDCGECVPTSVARAAVEIRTALEREGILGARRVLDVVRRRGPVGRISGVFEGPYPPAHRVPAPAGVRYQFLNFEIDDDRRVQLLSRDGPTPARIGQPRHVALLHHVFRHGPTTLFDALRASGSSAGRAENVYYEAREWVGPEWFQRSGTGSPHTRVIRLVTPPGCRLYEERVIALTDARAARRSSQGH